MKSNVSGGDSPDSLWGGRRRGRGSSRVVTESAIQARLRNFDPDARGADYRPFFLAGRALGIAKAFRVPHPCCVRELNHVSQLEQRGTALLVYQYQNNLVDVLEQYALPRSETRKAANALGVRHQVYPNSNIPVVMTTDAVFVVNDNGRERMHAVSFKYANDYLGTSPSQTRCHDVLSIEQAYWLGRGAEWRVYSERDIDLYLFFNLEFLSIWKCTVGMIERRLQATDIVPEFNRVWGPTHTLKHILDRCSRRLAISSDEAFLHFAECAWKGLLPVNLSAHPLDLRWEVPLINDKAVHRRARK
jgi:hypothetical protein